MKSTFTTKLLQHLSKKKQEGGFTLIELLVVIIIIGILAAIALPSFLNQANKAKQSEAKTYVGSMNRAQQAYYLENNKFAPEGEFDQLGLGIATSTGNYLYGITLDTTNNSGGTNQAKPSDGAGALNAQASVKAYIGGFKIGTATGTGEATTLAVLCEAKEAPIQQGDNGTAAAENLAANAQGSPTCPTTYKQVK